MKFLLKVAAMLWLFSLLTLTPVQASSQPKRVIVFSDWLSWVKTCARKYQVDPYLCLALAETESSNERSRFRFGKMGKGTFYGPFGIRKTYLKRWRIDDPFINTEVGIRALAIHLRARGSLYGALKKYNTEPKGFDRYYRRICSLWKQNERTKIFE